MPEITSYSQSYYSMTWLGPRGVPRARQRRPLLLHRRTGHAAALGRAGRALRRRHERRRLLLPLVSRLGRAGLQRRQGPVPRDLGIHAARARVHESLGAGYEGGFDEAFGKLRQLIDRGIPVQVGLHYSLLLPYGALSSPRLAFMKSVMKPTGFGHHVVVAGYDLQKQTVVIWEPNDLAEHARYECPLEVFRRAWEEPLQRADGHYQPWPHHYPWNGEWSLHDGYGPYLMVWVEPGRDPEWDIAVSIRDSFRRNLKIVRGEYPKPYALFGSQWQIPRWETGAPGMARCAEAILKGDLGDPLSPTGERWPLFPKANIANHGVLGRRGAAGYLQRVAVELAKRGLDAEAARAAASFMQRSSELFASLRYEENTLEAGRLLARIAEAELAALARMEEAWEQVRRLPRSAQAPAAAA